MKVLAWHRIWALVLRHLYLQFRDIQRIFDVTFWPAIDIVLFGFIGFWLVRDQSSLISAAILPLLGAFIWQFCQRSSVEISVNILEELWQQNLFNLFCTPLHRIEWIVALMLLGSIRVGLMVFFCAPIVYLFFGVNVFALWYILLPAMGALLLSGFTLGLLTSSVIIYRGQKAQSLAWVISWVFAPFCAVYYPLSVLPVWMQTVGRALPMTYVFEGMRQIITSGIYTVKPFLVGFSLALAYLVAAFILFFVMFTLSKRNGLVLLEKI